MSKFYHAFLSFRGDVREDFTRHLHGALKDDGFEAFMDSEDMRLGRQVKLTLEEAIKISYSGIVIFSKNYPSSDWCLDELILLLQRLHSSKFMIIPILYDVEASDVKYQNKKREFGKSFETLKQKPRITEEQKKNWTDALFEAGGLYALHFRSRADAGDVQPEPFEKRRTEFLTDFVKKFRQVYSLQFEEHLLPTSQNLIRHEVSVDQGASSSQLQSKQTAASDKIDRLTKDPVKEEPVEHSPPMVAKWRTISTNKNNARPPNTVQPNPDPLNDYLKCPPDGEAKVVLYTSSNCLENCAAVMGILDDYGVEFEERDARKKDKYKDELKNLVRSVTYPRLFVRGRDLGGLREVQGLHRSGELGAILEHHKQQQGNSRSNTSSNQADRTISKSKARGGYLKFS